MSDSSSPAVSQRNAAKPTKRLTRPTTSVGVEIGHGTIYMVQVKRLADGAIVFDKCGTAQFDSNLKPESSAFALILKAALKDFGVSSRDTALWSSPKPDKSRLHHIRIPKVSPSQLAGAVYWGLQREDTFNGDETIVDFQVEDGDGTDDTLEITGGLVERDCVDDVQKAFSQAGRSLTGMGLPLLALKNLVKLRSVENDDTPVLVCRMGQLSTNASVLLRGKLVFTRSIPLGLQSLAETLVRESGATISQGEACDIVMNLGVEGGELSTEEIMEQERAFSLLQPILERTVRQIERTMDYYQSSSDAEPMDTIFLGGEVAARGKLFHFISRQLSRRVIRIDPFDLPELQANAPLPIAKADRIAYGPAFGLALEATEDGINFANTYAKRQSEGKRNKIVAIVSVLMLLLAAAAAIFYNAKRIALGDVRAEKEKLEKQLTDLGPRLSPAIITQASDEVKILGAQRKAATLRYEGLALLSEITRLTPDDVSLVHVSAAMGGSITLLDRRTDSRGRSIKAFADKEGTMLLRGIVTGVRTSLETSLAIYIARLDQSPLFSGVEVESNELVQSGDEVHLSFTLNVDTIAEAEAP